MGIKRIVDVTFWTDNKVDDFSPEDKYFMLYLLTNPFTTQLGIYKLSIKQAAFQMGYSVDAFNVLLDRFESKYGMIMYSKETGEVAIKNFLRHSIIKGGAPVRDCLIKEMKAVKNKDLIAGVFSHIKGSEDLNETVKKIIAEYEEKNGILYYCNEKHNDNENDNDNEVSYHDSLDDSSELEPFSVLPEKILHEGYVLLTEEELSDLAKYPNHKQYIKRLAERIKRSGDISGSHYVFIKEQIKETKHKYGEYKHVLLTDAEYERLGKDNGIELRDKAIKFLDEYIEEKGYKSKSHNLAIRRWVINAVKEKEQKNGYKPNQRQYCESQNEPDDLPFFN